MVCDLYWGEKSVLEAVCGMYWEGGLYWGGTFCPVGE